jgi:RNA polymerase sigma factor (sigma-70 family)
VVVSDSSPEALAEFEPALLARARRLIGPGIRHLIAPSDLLQETLLIAVRRFAELSGKPRRQVLSWLLSSMQYRLMRQVRDHRADLRREEFGTNEAGGSSSPAGRLIREEVRESLRDLIDGLPEPEKRVVLRIYVDRRPTAEVAAELGRTEGAVRAIHQRAIRRLRKRLGGEGP